MYIFLLLAPLASAFLILAYHKVWERRAILRPFILGVIAYIPAWVILLVIEALTPEVYHGAALFLDALLVEHLVPIALAIALYFTLAGSFRQAGRPVFVAAMSAFFAGFFTLEALLFLALGPSIVTAYSLFILPLLRLGALAAMPVFMWGVRSGGGPDRYLFGFGAVMLPGVFAVVSYLNGLNYHLVAYVLTGVLVSLLVLLYLLVEGVIRGAR
ncbi:MAG: hypothetical protein ACOCYG_08550 [Spirochaetota bacterium]